MRRPSDDVDRYLDWKVARQINLGPAWVIVIAMVMRSWRCEEATLVAATLGNLRSRLVGIGPEDVLSSFPPDVQPWIALLLHDGISSIDPRGLVADAWLYDGESRIGEPFAPASGASSGPEGRTWRRDDLYDRAVLRPGRWGDDRAPQGTESPHDD